MSLIPTSLGLYYHTKILYLCKLFFCKKTFTVHLIVTYVYAFNSRNFLKHLSNKPKTNFYMRLNRPATKPEKNLAKLGGLVGFDAQHYIKIQSFNKKRATPV